jgi:hypothetical protein
LTKGLDYGNLEEQRNKPGFKEHIIMPREKTNFDINGERLVAFINQYDSYYKDGSSLEDWKKHPELLTEGYDEDVEDEDVEDDVEVNKDSRFLK